VIGRWTTKDPVLFSGGVGNGNLYVYVSNNPTTQVDPTGKSGLAVWGCKERRPIIPNDQFQKAEGERGYRKNAEGCLEFFDSGGGETADGATAFELTIRARPGGGAEYKEYRVILETSGGDKPTLDDAKEALEKLKRDIEEQRRREEGKSCGDSDEQGDCTKPKADRERCDEKDSECGG